MRKEREEKKKIHKYNRRGILAMDAQTRHHSILLSYVAMLSSLSSPVLMCDSTPDATVLALTGDVGEPV
jgi:hypothetical protein